VSPSIPIRRATDKLMLITEIGDRDQIAVIEDRLLVEHYITRKGAHSMVGNIYIGKVQNVLPGMEAAFIDVGRGRNAVLYAGEVSYDEELEGGRQPRIEQILKSGQNVLVQVTKDPIGGKGARLTQEISLPGRFLVLVPRSEVFGISRRLPDKERTRLKDILKNIRPPEHGVIARTASEGADAEDLKADLDRLIAEWQVIEKSSKKGKSPRVLYEEPELTIRVVRDLFTDEEFKEIVTDSPELHDRIVEYLKGVAPDLTSKVRVHTGPLGVMETYHVVEQIHKALDRKVWLPSGGYLVIGPDRGHDGRRREHRQARRQGQSRGDRDEDEPGGRPGDGATASAPRHRRHHHRRLHRHAAREEQAEGDRRGEDRDGPGQDPLAGLRHRPAGLVGDHSEADLRRAAGVVLGNLSHLRGPGHHPHLQAVRTTVRRSIP